MIPKGKFPISICTGTACYVRGAENVLAEFKKELNVVVGETTADGKFSLELPTVCWSMRPGTGGAGR
jgi:NADP-reducing hydrogenase subunit HndA